MSHITSIGAGIFTNLAIAVPATDLTAAEIAALDTSGEFMALFASQINSIGGTKAANTFVVVPEVREFPAIGVPPNIVNVPAYGSKTTKQIQAQSDSPTFELNVNFVPSEWASGTILGDMIGDGIVRIFRLALMNTESLGSGATKLASTAPGIGTVQNSQWFFSGRIEAQQISPSLSDANSSIITVSIQSKMWGAYTI